MGRRMSHSVKRTNSKNEQFRMVVPADLVPIVKKTEWTESLHTTDPVIGAARRGERIAFHKSLVKRLREQRGRQAEVDAALLIDVALDRIARIRGSMDAAIAQQLTLLASHVCDSWAPNEIDRSQTYGDRIVYEPYTEIEPVPSIDGDAERDVFRLRADILEGRGIADGFVYRELAAILLQRRVFRPIEFAVSYLRSIEPRLDLSNDAIYDAIAERYLTRLAEHSFDSWPDNIDKVMGPLGGTPISTPTPVPIVVQQQPTISPTPTGLWSMTLSEALPYWVGQRLPGRSAVTEATRAVSRFIALFGDPVIGTITRPQIIEFRNFVTDIPPQTEIAKVEQSGRTLRAVIDEARERHRVWLASDRKMPQPDRIAPGTVKKDIGAMSSILGTILDDAGDGMNVANNIRIAGYTKTREGQKKPRLPLTPTMMQKLFDSPLFTGCAGRNDRQRAQPGIHLYQDEFYWPFLFGVMGGPRLGEIGQIALSDIHPCDMRRTFGDEFAGHCTFVHITGTGEDQHTKNESSDRYVVLHDRLIELGFNDFVSRRHAAGKTTLFDLPLVGNASRTKALSQRLNRYIDRVVTDDARYDFHSMRHEFTDRAEYSDMPARVARSIKGHAHHDAADRYGLVSILAQWHHLKKLKVGFIDWDRLIAARDNAPAADQFAARRARNS